MGLTSIGICAQIISSIKTYKKHRLGTENDCKVTINHLVRKISEPLSKEGRLECYASYAALKSKGDLIREHIVPVKVIIEDLIYGWPALSFDGDNLDKLDSYLNKRLIIVTITPAEDALFNKTQLSSAMPKDYYDTSSKLYGNPWARYIVTGLIEGINLETKCLF